MISLVFSLLTKCFMIAALLCFLLIINNQTNLTGKILQILTPYSDILSTMECLSLAFTVIFLRQRLDFKS